MMDLSSMSREDKLALLQNLRARVKTRANQAEEQASYNPVNEMGALERSVVGAQAGALRPVRGALNVLGMDKTPDRLGHSDTDKYIEDTTAGKVGDFVGNTVALAPLTAAVGMPLAAAGRALPAASRLAGLVGPAAQAAAGGALMGALNADEGQRGEGALTGAAFGAGTYGLAKTLGKGFSKFKVTDYSPEFKQLREQYLPGIFAPGHRSFREGWVKKLMNVAANVPGSGPKMSAQELTAQGSVRDLSSLLGAPQTALEVIEKSGAKLPSPIDDPQGFKTAVQGGINTIFNKVSSTTRSVAMAGASGRPSAWYANVFGAANGIKDPVVRTKVVEFLQQYDVKSGGSPLITGDGIIDMYKGLNKLWNAAGRDAGPTGRAIRSVMDAIKKTVIPRTTSSTQGSMADWNRVFSTLDDFSEWESVKRAIKLAHKDQGKFTPAHLLRASVSKAGVNTVSAGAGPGQKFAQLAEAGVGEQGKAAGAFQTGLGLGLPVGSVIAGAAGMGPAAPAAYGVLYSIARTVGSERFQRALAGDLASQKAVALLLKNRPRELAAFTGLITAAATPEGE